MAIDGHFWVEGRVNGVPVNFLVDSGASVTTLSRQAAVATRLELGKRQDELVRTGNGIIRVNSGRADELVIGPLERRDVKIYVADQDELNVLGMNVLSTLKRWSVEGRWLVLET
jgi:aspartyl protease family protein